MKTKKLNNDNELKTVRKKQKQSQKKLAELSGMSQSTIASYENGTRNISKEVDRVLSDILGVNSLLIKQENPTDIALSNLKSFQAKNNITLKMLAERLTVDASLLSRVMSRKRKPTESFIKKIEELFINEATKLSMNINREDGSFCFPSVNRNELGERIHTIRKSREESLEKFGKNLTLVAGKNVVRRWELGINIPEIERLMNIAAISNTSVTYLLYGENFASMLDKGKTIKKFEKLDRFYFGMRLRKIRKRAGLTRHIFGKLFDPIISKWSMDRYEDGKDIPNTERVIQYAYIGKVSLEFLVYGNR